MNESDRRFWSTLTADPDGRAAPAHAKSDEDARNVLRDGSADGLRERLHATDLITPRKQPPTVGFRAWLWHVSGHTINLGASPDERHQRELTKLIDTNVLGTYTVAVLGGKGGVGKTAITTAIGSTFGSIRNDRVVAVDADPSQAANLAARIDPTARSVRDVNTTAAAGRLNRYADMRGCCGQNDAGLDVVASPLLHNVVAESIGEQEFDEAHAQMQRFYTLLFVDCGVDLAHPVMRSVLNRADALMMVASALPDGAEGASTNFEWLASNGFESQLSRAVLIINNIRAAVTRKDRRNTQTLTDTLLEHFSQWVPDRQTVVLPFDEHIAAAGPIDLDQLRPLTRRRVLEASAAIAAGFSTTTN